MPNPLDLNSGIVIGWSIPEEISKNPSINRIKVYRSAGENYGYELLPNMIDFPAGSQIPNTYKDDNGSRSYYYLVTFCDTVSGYESSYHVTFYSPLPRELRLINLLKKSFPDILNKSPIFNQLTDEDYLSGLNLAVQMFNVHPPATNFNLLNFPKSHEFFLIGFAQLLTLTSRYLPISIKDWSYSEPGGVTMSITRGDKVNQAIAIITQTYSQYLPLVKLDFAGDYPVGFGTIPLPLSMGGAISRGALNILNLFNMGG